LKKIKKEATDFFHRLPLLDCFYSPGTYAPIPHVQNHIKMELKMNKNDLKDCTFIASGEE